MDRSINRWIDYWKHTLLRKNTNPFTNPFSLQTPLVWKAEAGTYAVCVLHPGALSILFVNANTNDSPDHSLAGGHTASLVTLLSILREQAIEKKRWWSLIIAGKQRYDLPFKLSQ